MVFDRLYFLILYPPKTGSSSLRSLFLGQKFVRRPEFRKLSYPHYHLFLSELAFVHGLDAKSLSRYKIVQVTRNPIDRFISSWKHQERILNQKIVVDELIDKLFLYKELLPNNWREFYLKFYENPRHRDNSFQNGNWGGLRFYVDQVDWNDLSMKVHYFRLEDLSRDVTPLSEFLNMELPPLPKKNIGNYIETVTNLLNYSQKEKIFQLFERDFKAFDYEL